MRIQNAVQLLGRKDPNLPPLVFQRCYAEALRRHRSSCRSPVPPGGSCVVASNGSVFERSINDGFAAVLLNVKFPSRTNVLRTCLPLLRLAGAFSLLLVRLVLVEFVFSILSRSLVVGNGGKDLLFAANVVVASCDERLPLWVLEGKKDLAGGIEGGEANEVASISEGIRKSHAVGDEKLFGGSLPMGLGED